MGAKRNKDDVEEDDTAYDKDYHACYEGILGKPTKVVGDYGGEQADDGSLQDTDLESQIPARRSERDEEKEDKIREERDGNEVNGMAGTEEEDEDEQDEEYEEDEEDEEDNDDGQNDESDEEGGC
ncbi:hypothetical protein BDZ91DRAFT_769034 [Kalaharituber pfeilii]|nr:hypothetical protein BDZ91DRAFT_769034 [Kalaharituber pfeilii]